MMGRVTESQPLASFVHRLPRRWTCYVAAAAWLTVWIASSGAACISRRTIDEFAPPVVFDTVPSLPQLAEVVNRTDRIYALSSFPVTVRMEGVPPLSGSLEWKRERNFRMRGGLSRLTGTDFDVGSNDQIFWMASRHDARPTIYYAAHDRFAQQLNRQILPVSPLWIIEALGILTIDPDLVTATPQEGPDGLIRVVSNVPSPVGNYQRTLHVHPRSGIVTQVLLNDPQGNLLANAYLSDHQYYAAVQASLPHRSQIQLMPVGAEPLSLAVEIGFYRINEEANVDMATFQAPPAEGFTTIDIASLNLGLSSAVIQPEYQASERPRPGVNGLR